MVMSVGDAAEDTPDKISGRAALREALYSPRFERFITTLIILNAIILGALTYQYQTSGWEGQLIKALVTFDIMIVAIFIVEISLKIYVDGTRFFKSGWNVFDFFIVSVGFLGASYPLTIVRSLRVLRALRLVTRFPSMKIVIESFLRALPGMASVLGVMLLIIFIFSVIGTRLFCEISPELFGSLHTSAFTLFTVLTLEGWPDVASQVMPHSPWGGTFFILYIAFNSFVVLNLMIAVIIDAMHREYDMEAEEDREDIMREVKALRADIQELLKQKNA